ncbi:MAG TPA: cytochrome c-type biogenesis protein CcmH [Terriglobia bacterium]|nr:cytochrome c-type biogenesis protein CcmH [Terriglobia bacterium]
MRILLLGLVACLQTVALPIAQTTPKPTLEEVGNQVYCLCGCATTLNRCPHLPSECASRAQMQDLILKDIDQGKSEAAILQDLTERYGVRVLASPPAQGFDLTVWVLPGIGLIIGLIIVVLIVRKWWRKPKTPQASSVALDPKIMAEVEEEMNRMESWKD